MDYTIEDFSKFKQYLNTLDIALQGYFEDQREYIFCKKGCAHCCETGQYPYSDLEFKYLILGFLKLDMKTQQEVIRRIKTLKEEFAKCENKSEFRYRCPFLGEDKVCTVYEFRGLICRVFGLLTQHSDGSFSIPFCSSLGLNYSNVYDETKKKFDYDKIKKEGFKSLPKPHKTNLKTLMSPEMFECEPLQFGEIKSLVEWL